MTDVLKTPIQRMQELVDAMKELRQRIKVVKPENSEELAELNRQYDAFKSEGILILDENPELSSELNRILLSAMEEELAEVIRDIPRILVDDSKKSVDPRIKRVADRVESMISLDIDMHIQEIVDRVKRVKHYSDAVRAQNRNFTEEEKTTIASELRIVEADGLKIFEEHPELEVEVFYLLVHRILDVLRP